MSRRNWGETHPYLLEAFLPGRTLLLNLIARAELESLSKPGKQQIKIKVFLRRKTVCSHLWVRLASMQDLLDSKSRTRFPASASSDDLPQIPDSPDSRLAGCQG